MESDSFLYSTMPSTISICVTLTLTLGVCVGTVSCITECKQLDLCSCQFDDGSKMDLTSLGNTDNTPRFKDVLASEEGNYYSYNPCGGFKERVCKDASVCISNPAKTQSIQIGDASKAQFKYDPDTKQLVAAYTSGSIGRLLLSEVFLECEKSATKPSFTAQGQQEGGFFKMTLKTVCACPNGCSASGPNKGGGGSGNGGGGLSVGSILCIGLLVLIIIYVTLGTVTMKFVKKKEGVEIIPNVVFWRTLPVLIKNGTVFTFSRCFSRFRRQSYESK